MITHVFICNSCEGDIEKRTFERNYPSYREAEDKPSPACPRCKSRDVTRFFGHNIFCGNSRISLPIRYIPYGPEHRKGIVSIGMNVSEEQQHELDDNLQDMVQEGKVEIVQFEPHEDFTEKTLGLKKGTVDYALFRVRQKKLIEELRLGQPISGFFMPLNDESTN